MEQEEAVARGWGVCGGRFDGCEGFGPLIADPYMEDVHNEIVMVFLCGVCEHETAMEI